MDKLKGKIVIVTGATSGMGRAIAELFAREGASIIVGGRNRDRGAEVIKSICAQKGRAEFIASDISTYEGNQALVNAAKEYFGGVDILVPNAGVLGIGSLTEVSLEDWNQTINTNLNGVFYLLRAGIPELKKRGGGAVVVNGSIAAWKEFPNHSAYCTSKGALVSLVKQAALDFAPSIRVNLLCPGPVDTPLLWNSTVAFENPKGIIQEVVDNTIRMKRLGTPSDVAKAALFLASEDSSWVTGTSLVVDGGRMIGG